MWENRTVCGALTHWGRVTHICVVKLTIISSDNGLSPGRHQAIIWTNAGILLIGPFILHWNDNQDSYIFIQENAFENIVWKMAAILSRPQCVNVVLYRTIYPYWLLLPLLWRHNGHGSVSNHQPHDCLLSRLFRRRSKKTSKLRVTGLCAGNSPGTGEFPAQMASNSENVSIWWRHHAVALQCRASNCEYG